MPKIFITGIPADIPRYISRIFGCRVTYDSYPPIIQTKAQVMREMKRVGNTGNYLIGEGAFASVSKHNPTYIPFWHLLSQMDNPEFIDQINNSFDYCIFAPANMFRPGYNAENEHAFFSKLKLKVLIMSLGLQRLDSLENLLPDGTKAFLDVLRRNGAYVFCRGYHTAEFLQKYGLDFAEPAGCPSMFTFPDSVAKGLQRLSEVKFTHDTRISLNGYLGSVADIMVDAQALVMNDRPVAYILQDEMVNYNFELLVENDQVAYDAATGEILCDTSYKHSEKWKNKYRSYVFFDTNHWRVWLSKYHFVFGRRFHGAVIGLQTGTPSFMICLDDRMREMIQYFYLPHIEAAVWNRNYQQRAFLTEYLAKLDVSKHVITYRARDRTPSGSRFTKALFRRNGSSRLRSKIRMPEPASASQGSRSFGSTYVAIVQAIQIPS